MKIKIVNIPKITIKERNRQFNPEKAKEIAYSIQEIGLLHPIVIDNNYNLIAGLHRLEAAKLLSWTEIPCNIFDIENAEEEAEIHENLIRAELTELEKADLLCRAKEIYELRYPESKRAEKIKRNLKQFVNSDDDTKSLSDESNNNKDCQSTDIKNFTDDIANKTNKSSRSIQRLIQISKNISSKVKEKIRHTQFADSKNDLLILARLTQDAQEKVAEVIVKRKIKRIKDAIYQIRKEDFNRSLVKAETATQENSKNYNDALVVSCGDVFRLGDNHILICGDNTDPAVIKYLSQFHFSFVFADPPYNLGRADYDKENFVWSQDYLTEISDIVTVTPGINNAGSFIKCTEMQYRWLLICHVKNLKSGGAIGYTHYYPVFLFSNLKSVNFGIKDLFDIALPPMPDEDREIANKRQKPAGLLTYMINGFSKEGDFILDPFAGSGQTLMVCEALNRRCVTIEILPEMVKAIINRFIDKFGIKAIKLTHI